MPTYEYACEKCGHEFEVFQSIAAPALKICPADHCARKKWGRGKVKKKIGGGAGLLFKGSGFYITDYRSESYKQSAKSADSSAKPADSGSKAPAKTEAPAAPKPTPKSDKK